VIPVLLVTAVLIGVGVAFYYERNVAPFESTDDAFVEGHVTYVAARVSGQVVRVLVDDNQEVKAGDVLAEIDPRDFQTRLTQAQADVTAAQGRLEEAKAQIAVADATAAQRTASVKAAQAEATRAESEAKRYENVEASAVTKSQVELVEAQRRTATANLQAAESFERAAQAQVGLSRATASAAVAAVQQAQAAQEQARLNLSYTKVVAPLDGKVTRRTVEAGAYVQTGQALLAIVPHDVWVVANFKETQLRELRVGQPATIRIDAFGGREFRAHVDSLQAGAGARFSLLPPENAVGNYVKVVQRVPVKIVFDEALDPKLDIAPGMSVTPKVRVK
jgi:membrane fusion protein (multidrug efflux system)